MPAVGLTDHGSMAGSVELARATAAQGIKPIFGCEIYVVDDHAARVQREKRAHLTLLAETTEGYHNLIRLVSAGYLDGYWYKPRVDFDQLAAHAGGIIALSGCLSGRVCKALADGDDTGARGELDRLVQIFGKDQVYVELQDGKIDVQTRINPGVGLTGNRRRAAAGRHRRRPLPDRRRRHPSRGAALHPDPGHAREPEPLQVLKPRVLSEVPGADVRADGGQLGRGHAAADGGDRRPLLGRPRPGHAAPAEVRRARGQDGRLVPA